MLVFIIALGGALGTVLRYGVSRGLYVLLGSSFPYGTVAVNVLGSFCIGLFISLLLDRFAGSPLWRAFLQIGILGGFTTFSSFSWETFMLYQQSQFAFAFLNIILNVVLSLGAVVLGTFIARII